MKALNRPPRKHKVVLLNTSILTSYGNYQYIKVRVEDVREMVGLLPVISAIGHESTAEIMSSLLGIKVPVNRIQYKQVFNDLAIVFKLNGRPPEGKILTKKEIEKIGHEWGYLEKF